jgi:hypothetical protein
MNKHLPILTTALILTSTVIAAYAEPIKERGGYIGGAIGASNFDDDDIYGGFADLDDDSTAYQLYGGYRFMKYFALEGRLTSLGEFEYSGNFDAATEDWQFGALTVNALGIYPFGDSGFDIYGQLGVGIITVEIDTNYGFDDDDSGSTFTAGAGVRYTPPRFQAMTFGLGYDVYAFENEVFSESLDQTISMAKLNIQYNF